MKTAVEWLEEKLTNGHYLDEGMKQKIFEQAKEIEKEQKGYSEKDIRNAIEMAQDWKSIVKSRGKEWIEFKYTHQEIINKIKNL